MLRCCHPRVQTKRLSLLGAAALCEGASVGTLVAQVLDFDPRYEIWRFVIVSMFVRISIIEANVSIYHSQMLLKTMTIQFSYSTGIGCCSIVMVAFLGSTAIFACFSGAALLAKRREYLFLGGILSSVISTMAMMQFGSLFFGRGAFMFNVEVPYNLAISCLI